MRAFDLSPLFRSSVGFDHLNSMVDAAMRDAARDVSFPPYNILKTDNDRYRITMALAGFAPGDLDITVHDNLLTVKGQVKEPEQGVEYLHRGIARRAFEHRFQLADHVRVARADLVNGLLDIQLERVVPEAMKPRRIDIGGGKAPKVVGEGTGEPVRPKTIKAA